jgi:hypothetical protein
LGFVERIDFCFRRSRVRISELGAIHLDRFAHEFERST